MEGRVRNHKRHWVFANVHLKYSVGVGFRGLAGAKLGLAMASSLAPRPTGSPRGRMTARATPQRANTPAP